MSLSEKSKRAAAAYLKAAKAGLTGSPSLKNLASMPLTVAGLACVCAGVLLASTVAGLIVTGVLLVVLEFMIADS